MNLNAHTLLIGIALLLTIVSFFKPQWPLINVAVLLIAVDLLVAGR
jgi:hypothetical protein